MTSDYYVYVLLDSSKPGNYNYGSYSFEYEPFYVGKGRLDRIKNTIYDKSKFKKNKIESLINKGIEIISKKVLTNLTNENSINKEIELISLIGRRDNKKGTLVNTTDGGDGRLSSKPTKETIEKISKNRKGKGIGWKHTKKTINIMKENQKGNKNGFFNYKHTDKVKREHSDRISGNLHPMYGVKHKDDVINKLKENRTNESINVKIKESCQKFNKPVLMYNLEFELIKEFKSVKDVSDYTSINSSVISKCCRGDIKSPTRFFFRYKNDSDNIKNNKFLINIGDVFTISRKQYKLLKRNKKTCVCLLDGKEITLHIRDYDILFRKETNKINIIELYLFIKKIDNSFKVKGNFIYNDKLTIKYNKLINNSELLKYKSNDDSDCDILIFEDEWKNKKEITKSRIVNLLGKSDKIGARKCEIKEISDNKLIRKFLNENHIQGFVGSRIKIGLFYENELVSIMTFGSLRKSMGQISKENTYELLRFCNKKGLTVMGGASRLFRYFLNNFKVNEIISYADKRWSNGNLYEKLGFSKLKDTVNNYYWIVDNKREYRFRYRKDILVKKGYDPSMTEIEIMNSLGHFRIFDKGNMKYLYKNNL